MKTKIDLTPTLVEATIADYPIMQNMGRFYIYDFSRHCGLSTNHNWACPDDGLYECIDFSDYFNKNNYYPFLVKVGEELAGFALIDKVGTGENTDWNMGEFYIVAKFQGTGVAAHVFRQVLAKFSGQWEISVIPENTPAVKFWQREINKITNGKYTKQEKMVDYDQDHPNRLIFTFDY